MLKAIIFDMDGVLIDSMPYHAQSWIYTFNKAGIESVSKEDIYNLEGSNSKGMIEKIFEQYNKVPKREHFDQLPKLKKEHFFNNWEIKEFTGMNECLTKLKKKFSLAVVSGADQKIVREILNQQYPNIFDVIITGNDVNNGKPDPEPYLNALEQLKIEPDECLVVENATFGVVSAKNAGIYCIAIPTYVKPDKLKDADKILDNHQELIKYLYALR